MSLTSQRCGPCHGGIPPLSLEEVKILLLEIPGWQLQDNPSCLQREYKFKNFKQAMVFVNQVAEIAEDQKHHPDFQIIYNRVILKLNTHAIKGLSKNDFIVAAKINERNP